MSTKSKKRRVVAERKTQKHSSTWPPALVLSLFPGVGLLDRAFEAEGFCTVRGPDLLWGGDITSFHPMPGRFDGVIGGPPCQRFSSLSNIVRAVHGEASLAPNLIPEFERIIAEARPRWFLMENVPAAPVPKAFGYTVHQYILNNRECDRGDGTGADQNRVRRFSFGTWTGSPLELVLAQRESSRWQRAVTSKTIVSQAERLARPESVKPPSRPFSLECELQGLPRDFLAHAPLTAEGKRRVLANGVPLAMGRTIARAVKRAICARSSTDAA